MFGKNFLFKILIYLSSIILIYIFYKSEILFNGEKRDYYLKYYLFFFFFIVLNFLFIFLKSELKFYLNITFISIFFSLYLFEFYIIFYKKNKKEIYYEQKYKKKFDTRTTIQFYNDLKKTKNLAVKIGGYNFLSEKKLDIFPLSGVSNILTVNCNESGYFSTYNSDRFGFNNNDNSWDEKNIEIVVVGDSFTHGACVFNKDSIVGNLKKITKSNIINLSITGNGPLMQYASLKEYVSDLNINKILWFFSEGNDFYNLLNELKDPNLSQYLKSNNYLQNLKKKQFEIDKISFLKINENARLEPDERKLVRFIKLDTVRKLLLNDKKTKYGIGSFNEFEKNEYSSLLFNFSNILNIANQFSKKKNAQLYLVYMPEYSRYKENYKNLHILNDVKNIAENLNIEFIDIDKLVFQNISNPLSLFPYESFFHYNENGYKLVAEAIGNYIKK